MYNDITSHHVFKIVFDYYFKIKKNINNKDEEEMLPIFFMFKTTKIYFIYMNIYVAMTKTGLTLSVIFPSYSDII